MTPLRKLIALFISFACSLILCSCWDRHEINDIAIVLSSAIDLEDDGSYRITYLVPIARQLAGATKGGSSSGQAYYLDSESAPSIGIAMGVIQKRMARHIALSHRRTIIIGESLANKGIGFLFDFYPRFYENRLSTKILVSKGRASDLLEATPQFERFPSEALREILTTIEDISFDFKEVAQKLSANSDPVIPYFEIKEVGNGSKTSKELQHIGYAQFYQDKMVDRFLENTASGLLWLLGHPQHQMLSVTNQEQPITVFIVSGQTSIVPVRKNEKIAFEITVHANFRLRDDFSQKDMMIVRTSHELERLTSVAIEKQIQECLQQMYKHQTDSIQLSQKIWRMYPIQTYEEAKDLWKSNFNPSACHVHVNATLLDPGLIYHNFTGRRSS